MLQSADIADAMQRIAEKIQAEAVRTSPVDTGRYAASWRVTQIQDGRRAGARVTNHAPYSAYVEFGYRHHRSGRHIPGQHVLRRAIDAART